ncbi:GlcNac transferase [Achlya hypogyna]|uniref:GlcNac transferase n=1 Tax=Achlya hypogyna TaxID=1202772 RepID=A0A1V9YLI9_ACHHY|nr:GlcNac transferase [Achlya hypogyna]
MVRGVLLTLLIAAAVAAVPELAVRDHNKDKSASKRPTVRVPLNPAMQNSPMAMDQRHLRPPPPVVSADHDIFVGLSAFRDGARCGKTIFTGFSRAERPDRLFFGVVDQLLSGDEACVDAYCKLAAKAWPGHACKYRDQITVDARDAATSRGPTYARHFQQKLVGDQEFCLQLDAHSEFTTSWDSGLVHEWTRTGNEMAILTTYLHDIYTHIHPNGTNLGATTAPHICQTTRGGSGNVRNVAADLIYNSQQPQMSALWGAGLSFSKCHAERRVPIDSHTKWMFDGEEFLRAAHLWTYGYDMYSPSVRGLVVYHNYTAVPAKFFELKVDRDMKALETKRANNRVKFLVGRPFVGEIDAEELDVYGWGNVRSFAAYLNFSGLSFVDGVPDRQSCEQLHWVPYANAAPIEALVPGWKLAPATTAPPETEPVEVPTAAVRAPAAMRRGKGWLPAATLVANAPPPSLPIAWIIFLVGGSVVLYFVPRSHAGKYN